MLQKNLQYFQNSHPALFRKLIKVSPLLQLEPSRNDTYPTVKLKNRYIYSKYAPLKEADKKIKSVHYHNQKNLIFLGYGLGYYLIPLIPISEKNIWIYEKDISLFYHSLTYIDYTELCSRNSVFFNISTAQYFPNTNDLKSSIFFENPVLTELHQDFYIIVQTKIKNILETAISDITTLGYFSPIWFRNSILNLQHINHSYSLLLLKNKFKNFSACFAAGGPNLEKTIHLLKQKKDSAVIVSSGTAARRLLAENITPHFIISVDGGYYNSWHTRNLSADSILITDFSAHFLSSRKYSGKLAFINYNLGYTDFLADFSSYIPVFPMYSTVSAAAAAFIRFLGIRNIFLFGQDFSFPFYQTHCKSTIYEKYSLLVQNRMNTYASRDFKQIMNEKLETALNYNQKSVPASLKLKLYKEEFAQQDFTLYQTCREAASVQNIPYNSDIPEQAESAAEIINRNLTKINIPIDKKRHLSQIRAYLKNLSELPVSEFLKKTDKSFSKGLLNYLEFDLQKHSLESDKIRGKIKKYLFFIEKFLKKK